MPMCILLLNAWLNKQAVRINQLAGILLALAGVIYVVTMGNNGALEVNPGDLIMLIAVLCFSLYSVLLKRIPAEINAGGLLLVLMSLGVVGILPFFSVDIINNRSWDWQDSSNWLIVSYVAIFPSIGSYFFWNFAVKKGGPLLTGLSFNLLPVFTILLAFFFLGISVTLSQILAVILIFVGIAMGLKPPVKLAAYRS